VQSSTGDSNREKGALNFEPGSGGNMEKNISVNIVEGLKVAKSVGERVIGAVGRHGGYTGQVADACVVVPTVNSTTVKLHTVAFKPAIWHRMVSHPKLTARDMKGGSGSMKAAASPVPVNRE
jgi:D-sedoheptulose 7-phosphate isomerase